MGVGIRLFKPKMSRHLIDPTKKMARKPNYTAQEINVLLDEVEKRRLILLSKQKYCLTNAEKTKAWDEVAARVNSVGVGYQRDGENVRHKWRDFSSVIKKKASTVLREQQKTGAGKTAAPQLSALEERVLGILGPEALEGVPGGIDVCATRMLPEAAASSSALIPASPPFPASHSPQPLSPSAQPSPSPQSSPSPRQPSQPPSSRDQRGHQSARDASSPEESPRSKNA